MIIYSEGRFALNGATAPYPKAVPRFARRIWVMIWLGLCFATGAVLRTAHLSVLVIFRTYRCALGATDVALAGSPP